VDRNTEAAVDDLYDLPAGEFVAARDQLVKRLRQEKQREAAAEVAKLRRPSVVAAAVNRVARSHPDDVDALLDAGAALRDAQEGAVGGASRGQSGDALREAMRARRDVVRRLAGEAVKLAGSEAHRDEVVATLEAASVDADTGDLVRRGRLTKEVAPPAWGDVPMADVQLRPAPAKKKTQAEKPGAKKKASQKDELAERRERVKREKEREKERAKRAGTAADARRAAGEAEAEVAALEKELDRLTKQLDRARAKAEKAATKADDAEARLAELEED
jgi:hypothetical protein